MEHPDTLGSVNNLGNLLRAKGDYEGAEALYRRALEGFEKVLGVEHPDTLLSVNSLGNLLYSKGDNEGAELLYRRGLAGFEKALGLEHPNTLMSLGNLGLLLHAKGDYEGAEALYRRALADKEKTLGMEHPDTLMSARNLGEVLNCMGRRQEAIGLLHGYAVMPGATAHSLTYNLACYECLDGNVDDAKQLIRAYLASNPSHKQQALADFDLATIREFISRF
jgi:tetratricopeptide (TPR) repeat protein